MSFYGKAKAPGWDLLNQKVLSYKTDLMNEFLANCLIECMEKD